MVKTHARGSQRFLKTIDFNIFYKASRDFFEIASSKHPRHQLLKEIYAFHVVPGGRDGGYDSRTVDVFYGIRPFDSVLDWQQPTASQQNMALPRLQRRVLTESGAQLRYILTARGMVICLLTPAYSSDYKHKEDFIVLEWIKNPHILTGIPKIKQHFNYLASYMEVTSVDGEPRLIDRVRVAWIKFAKTIVINNKETQPSYITYISSIIKFSLTVGLSGFVLVLINLLMPRQ